MQTKLVDQSPKMRSHRILIIVRSPAQQPIRTLYKLRQSFQCTPKKNCHLSGGHPPKTVILSEGRIAAAVEGLRVAPKTVILSEGRIAAVVEGTCDRRPPKLSS